jgi:hypothetical protein
MHLLKAEAKGAFSATCPERPSGKTEGTHPYDMPMSIAGPQRDQPLAVAPVMTPEDRYDYNPRSMSVENLPPRVRGKHY